MRAENENAPFEHAMLVLSWEDWKAPKELKANATGGPDVDRRAIRKAEENLTTSLVTFPVEFEEEETSGAR